MHRATLGGTCGVCKAMAVGFIEWLGLTFSRQQLRDDPGSRGGHTYARAWEPAALPNDIYHIIKSPPLMSRDAPVM